MNEQRQQAYFNLIQTLLNCRSNNEILEILAANQDLLDAAFLQTLEAVGAMFSQQGDENTANGLQGLANYLKKALNLDTEIDLQSPREEERQTYLQFLMRVLQAIEESRGNAQAVYPLLAKNTDKLNGTLAEILRQWGTNTLREAEADGAKYLAALIALFSTFIAQFPLGDKASNMEIAITGYEIALTVYTHNAFPQQWAEVQMNLGNAYIERIRGERAENIEKAIAALTEALAVYTQSTFPQGWAAIQHNLGTAYIERIRGERAENIEKSIAAFTEALAVCTQSNFPQEWAETQNNLGSAYIERIRGERAENIEKAITCLQGALKTGTFNAFPQQWVQTQINFGNAYYRRIRGERAENIEKSIVAFTEALAVCTQSAFPQQWANLQNNLGNAYCDRLQGERAENMEKAIAAFTEALTVYTRSAFPQLWAQTQSNIGTAYGERTREEKAENIEKAIAAFTGALTVYTQSAFPNDWAAVQHNLGTAYSNRIWGERAENIEKAIAAFTGALTVRTQSAFPQYHAESLWSLGFAYRSVNQFTLAYNTFESAIATTEFLRDEIVSGEETKRKQAEAWTGLYSQMIEVCLQLGNIVEAIEYVERSKTRNLVEQILERDFKSIFPAEVVTQLEKYKDEIATGQYQIQNGEAENPQFLAQHLQELRQQRNELQNRYLPVGYGFKFDSFQAALNERTAIIEWYILNEKILAFIVAPRAKVTVWQSQSEDQQALTNWANQYLRNYYNQKDQWQNSLGEELKKLASILHIDEILNQISKHCDKLILIPHRFLHLFPLHALPITSQNYENSPCLLNLFAGGVSYAPSCQLLQQVQLRQRPEFQYLFAIQNPTEDLDYAELEVDSILNLFSFHQVLPYEQATKVTLLQQMPQLKKANYLHFSCHGSFNFNSPQDSCLILAESIDENNDLNLSKCLTLGNLFELDFQLDNCRLVVLSACETGLVDFNNTSDEYISLPSGFLYAGSASVVSSMWTVNDLYTAFLMIKFSQNLQNSMADSGDFSVAVELQKAQLWLRDVTTAELHIWASKLKLSRQVNKQLEQFLYYCEHYCEPEEKQFQNPYHWAGFCAIGL